MCLRDVEYVKEVIISQSRSCFFKAISFSTSQESEMNKLLLSAVITLGALFSTQASAAIQYGAGCDVLGLVTYIQVVEGGLLYVHINNQVCMVYGVVDGHALSAAAAILADAQVTGKKVRMNASNGLLSAAMEN